MAWAVRSKVERARIVREVLRQCFPVVEAPLDHRDPFTLLVAVMLSAQTTDARVNLVTPALFARASTPAEMAQLTAPEILSFIKTCGLAPTKAKNILRTSELLLERHDGVVPADLDALEALPGVGHKTASVVVSHAFGIPAFPVDTHIQRCAERWGLSSGKNVATTERDLKRLYPPETWNDLHIQIILFGRKFCPARGHQVEDCPICSVVCSPDTRAP